MQHPGAALHDLDTPAAEHARSKPFMAFFLLTVASPYTAGPASLATTPGIRKLPLGNSIVSLKTGISSREIDVAACV